MKRLLSLYWMLFLSVALFSQTKQIENLQKQQLILKEEIRNTNKLFLDVKKHTTTILDRINLINKQIESRKKLISTQEQELSALEKEEARLTAEIEELNKDLEGRQKQYAKTIKGLLNNKYRQNKLLFILSGKSLGESLRRAQYLREYSQQQKQQAEEIKKKNAELNLKKEKLEQAKVEKQRALTALESEQNKLQSEEKTHQSEMAEARQQQSKLQKTLQDKQRQVNQLNAQIEKLIAEEVARQEREAAARRRAAEEAARARKEEERRREEARRKSGDKRESETSRRDEARPKTEPKIESNTATASAETFNLSKNFAANKGRLPMPVTGTSTIVGKFGMNKHSEWNISTNSNGIDIQAQQGADIRSVYDGEVSKVFSFPSANTCVIVRHGDYYTFYANIYDLYVKQGDKVKAGQALGRIYTDPDTGISTMHFQLWQKTHKLDPAPWLRR
ncbi:MAG TPA: hypothetical protein DDZ96_13920 [Porphyromonadaceae bacterium]|jgi:septal ring factor EnvC (AmiA/AmiB activator)|nr:hypothetical protein [Porphyromonadaceae bacterium]HBL34889.1 hypothetical protein [Porphyromonadaceae bacterium]HCM19807.1 hypothetical protein [Porphyromonadaceae bacterium]